MRSDGLATARWIALLVPLALIGGALGFQFIGHLVPCEMCMWQRWPHYAAILLAALAFVARDRVQQVLLLSLACTAIAASGAIGVFHAGVEYHWWPGITRAPRRSGTAPAAPTSSTDPQRPDGALRRAAMVAVPHLARRLQRALLAGVCACDLRAGGVGAARMSGWRPGDRRGGAASMVRVDRLANMGATRIYAGQLAVMGDRTPAARAIAGMLAQEERHRRFFDAMTARRGVRPTALQPLWNVAGYALGAVTAAIGPEAAMACTAAVETEIDRHYGQQLELLGDADPNWARRSPSSAPRKSSTAMRRWRRARRVRGVSAAGPG